MNIFRDKRMVRSLLLLSWPVLLLFFGIWLWASLELPQAGDTPPPRNKVTDPEPVGLKRLFESFHMEAFKVALVSNNPFYYPVPAPPPPPPAPPPPVPTTKAHKLHYKGFFTTTHGDKFVYLGVDDAVKLQRVGDLIVEDLYLMEIEPKKLLLKTGENSVSEMALELPFDIPQSPQVPLKKS
ncbi:MAG: hypothetical protein PHF61_10545 [Bacteroidales bacterium]|nr:hypothetical protein [Bacteroidales bacterium]